MPPPHGKSKMIKKFLQMRARSESWSFSSQRKANLGIAAKHAAEYVVMTKSTVAAAATVLFSLTTAR
jgi:hypothetical protein